MKHKPDEKVAIANQTNSTVNMTGNMTKVEDSNRSSMTGISPIKHAKDPEAIRLRSKYVH